MGKSLQHHSVSVSESVGKQSFINLVQKNYEVVKCSKFFTNSTPIDFFFWRKHDFFPLRSHWVEVLVIKLGGLLMIQNLRQNIPISIINKYMSLSLWLLSKHSSAYFRVLIISLTVSCRANSSYSGVLKGLHESIEHVAPKHIRPVPYWSSSLD